MAKKCIFSRVVRNIIAEENSVICERDQQHGLILPSGTTEEAVPSATLALLCQFSRNLTTCVIGEVCMEVISALRFFGNWIDLFNRLLLKPSAMP